MQPILRLRRRTGKPGSRLRPGRKDKQNRECAHKGRAFAARSCLVHGNTDIRAIRTWTRTCLELAGTFDKRSI